jgi:hypothetical protein
MLLECMDAFGSRFLKGSIHLNVLTVCGRKRGESDFSWSTCFSLSQAQVSQRCRKVSHAFSGSDFVLCWPLSLYCYASRNCTAIAYYQNASAIWAWIS